MKADGIAEGHPIHLALTRADPDTVLDQEHKKQTEWNPKKLIAEANEARNAEWSADAPVTLIIRELEAGNPDKAMQYAVLPDGHSVPALARLRLAIYKEWDMWKKANGLDASITPSMKREFEAIPCNVGKVAIAMSDNEAVDGQGIHFAFTRAEADTVLAALRNFQAIPRANRDLSMLDHPESVLDDGAIDALCETRINAGGDPKPPVVVTVVPRVVVAFSEGMIREVVTDGAVDVLTLDFDGPQEPGDEDYVEMPDGRDAFCNLYVGRERTQRDRVDEVFAASLDVLQEPAAGVVQATDIAAVMRGPSL